jgi:hypothetical protein
VLNLYDDITLHIVELVLLIILESENIFNYTKIIQNNLYYNNVKNSSFIVC